MQQIRSSIIKCWELLIRWVQLWSAHLMWEKQRQLFIHGLTNGSSPASKENEAAWRELLKIWWEMYLYHLLSIENVLPSICYLYFAAIANRSHSAGYEKWSMHNIKKNWKMNWKCCQNSRKFWPALYEST